MTRANRLILFLLFLWHILILCAYYLLRPVRSALLLADFGPAALPWVYMGTALATGAAVWAYARFARLPRRLLIGGLQAFFGLNIVAWWLLARRGCAWVSPAFYVWTDVFSIMSVTLFWTYANDLFESEEAGLSYGLLTAAGTAGATLGAGLTRLLVRRLGAVNMLLASSAACALGLAVFLCIEAAARDRTAAHARTLDRFERYDYSGLASMARTILSSRALLLLGALACFERGVPDLLDYVFQYSAHGAYPDREAFAEFFAGFELIRGALEFLAAAVATGWVLKRWGATPALCSAPGLLLAGFSAFLAAPSFGLLLAVDGLDSLQRHSWHKAGKEWVYTATNRDVIYKVKAFIEMFLYRFARGLAGLLIWILTGPLALGPQAVAAAGAALAALWLPCAWKLGTLFQKTVRAE